MGGLGSERRDKSMSARLHRSLRQRMICNAGDEMVLFLGVYEVL